MINKNPNKPLRVRDRIRRWFGYTDGPKEEYEDYFEDIPSHTPTIPKFWKRATIILLVLVLIVGTSMFMLWRYYETHPDQHDLTFIDWTIEHILKVVRSIFLGEESDTASSTMSDAYEMPLRI